MFGEGAEQFARQNQIEFKEEAWFYDAFRFKQWKELEGSAHFQLDHSGNREKKFGTVGAVALDAEGNLSFSSEHKAHKTHAENVHLRFVLKAGKPPKTAAEDAGSTEAPHQDDHAPPHGGATSEGSHEPASSQPH